MEKISVNWMKGILYLRHPQIRHQEDNDDLPHPFHLIPQQNQLSLLDLLHMVCVAPCKGVRIPESEKLLLVESGILGLGIRNTAVGIRNSTNNWNPESKFH